MSELKNIKFDFIRYANCWEDADILLKGLKIKQGEKVISICSAGDNSFSLLTQSPEIVIAIDLNPSQIALAKLKHAAIQNLEYEEYLSFAGFRHSDNRIRTFQLLKKNMDPATGMYWEKNMKGIKNGIIHYGKFERYFRLFANWILPLIHTGKRKNELFRIKNESEQIRFYNEKWNNKRWRLLFKIFFSRMVMGRLGRDPKFMDEVKIPVGEFIFSRAEEHLKSINAQTNFMLRYQLTGQFGDLLPHYAQKENYYLLRENLNRIHYMEGYVQDACSRYGKIHAMNLSDIFEYPDENNYRELSKILAGNTETNGRLAYWNLMVSRNLSEIMPGELRNENTDYSSNDKGFFYRQFIVNSKI